MITLHIRRIDGDEHVLLRPSSAHAGRDESLRRPLDRSRSVVADLLLEDLVQARGGRTHRYLPTGQPVSDLVGVHLSASHDGSWVAAAGANGPVGIDIVDIARFDRIPARLILSRTELDSADAHSESALGKAARWAVKEAYTKCLGVGLKVQPRSLTVALGADGWCLVSGPSPKRRSWACLRPLDDGHLLAISASPHLLAELHVDRGPSVLINRRTA